MAGGETLTLEFKGSVNDSELVEAVVCLANASGGTLLIGIDDDGSTVGASHRQGQQTDPARVAALIASRTVPAVVSAVSVIEDPAGEVIAIVVPQARSVVATSGGKYVRRVINVHGQPECLPMRPHEVLSRLTTLGAQDFSTVPVGNVRLADLSLVELERFRNLARSGGDRALADLDTADLVGALGLVTPDERLGVGAVLLFGSEELIAQHLPAYEVVFQELDGSEVRVNQSTRRPLLAAMEDLDRLVQARNPEHEVDVGLFRVGLPDSPIRPSAS